MMHHPPLRWKQRREGYAASVDYRDHAGELDKSRQAPECLRGPTHQE